MSSTRTAIAASAKANPRSESTTLAKCVAREAKTSAHVLTALIPGSTGSGQPLSPSIGSYFATRFSAGLSDVRVNPNSPAVAAVGARAVTMGQHIAFAPGQYRPDSSEGLRLIGHEVIHTLQQSTQIVGGAQVRPALDTTAAECQAEKLADVAVRGGKARVSVATSVGPAFALSDYVSSSASQSLIDSLTVSQLQSDIDEISEYLDRQLESSAQTGHLENVRAQLQARLASLLRGAHTDPPRRGRGRGSRARLAAETAATPEPGIIADPPRILSEQRSVELTDPTEVQREVDRIVTWLQRPDVSAEDRRILRGELGFLAPQFEEARQANSTARRTERLRVAFGSGGEEVVGLRSQIRIVEGIYNDPGEPRAAFIFDRGERIRISREQAEGLRRDSGRQLMNAVRRARNNAETALGSYSAQKEVNEEFPVVSAISGWLGGVDDPGVALANANARVAASAAQAQLSLDGGNLSAAIDPLEVASTQSRRMSMAAYAYREGLISGAESAVTGLTFVRDCSAAITIAIGAVVAAPFVAGAVGAGGLGLTGTSATVATIGGTGLTVGSGAATTFGAAEYGGRRLAGESHEEALAAANVVAEQRFTEGFSAGAGGATTRVASAAFSGGATVSTTLGTRLASQGAGNFVGGTSSALLNGADLDDALLHGGRSAAVGSVGTFAGAPFGNSPILQTGANMAAGTTANYFDMRAQGATSDEALRASTINLATAATLHSSPGIQRQQAGYEESGARFGASVRSTAVSTSRSVGNYARAGALGLALSAPPAFGSGSSGSPTILAPGRPGITAPVDSTAAIVPASTVASPATTPVPPVAAPSRIESTGARSTARASSSARSAIQEQVDMGFLDPHLAAPGAAVATATSRTPRSVATSIRSQTGELSAYDARLARGEIGLLAPVGSTVPGADYATAVRRPDGLYEIVVIDAKSRVSSTSAFGRVRTSLPATWRAAVAAALSPGRLNLGDAATEQSIRDAWAQGRVRIARDTIDYSPTGQGDMNLDN